MFVGAETHQTQAIQPNQRTGQNAVSRAACSTTHTVQACDTLAKLASGEDGCKIC
jgi:hypothetical protein